MSKEIDELFAILENFKFDQDSKTLELLCDHKECQPRIFTETAFFPGGDGLWKEKNNPNPVFPKAGIMILGHDFGSKSTYPTSTSKSEDFNLPTWKGLHNWFAPDNFKNFFFTNAYMGIRIDPKSTGPIKRGKEFNKQCFYLLKKQIELQKPRVIFTLGLQPIKALDKTLNLFEEQLQCTFDNVPIGKLSFTNHIDKQNNLAIRCVDLGFGYKTKLIALTHPSMPNEMKRKPIIDGKEEKQGKLIEIGMNYLNEPKNEK